MSVLSPGSLLNSVNFLQHWSEVMIDYRSYTHNLSSCEIKAFEIKIFHLQHCTCCSQITISNFSNVWTIPISALLRQYSSYTDKVFLSVIDSVRARSPYDFQH